jgi:hypothetical protein
VKPLKDHVLHQLSDCPLFYLPNPLAADAEHRGDLVERAGALVRDVEGSIPHLHEVVLPLPAMSEVVSTFGMRAGARGPGFDTLGNARVSVGPTGMVTSASRGVRGRVTTRGLASAPPTSVPRALV